MEALLAEDAGAENFLERPALEAVAKMFGHQRSEGERESAKQASKDLDESWIGRKLGSYQILSVLGKGGMGEVYRAQDTNLRRDVALKVLPEAFAHDPERLARFRREARLLASLNHNNVGAIYEFEQSGNVNFLVLELVPGETLRDRIVASGPLPVEEALGIAKQIAEAMEAAHEKGMIHRDLKPANIKVTPEGKVKVLDFGLGKAFGGDETMSDPSESAIRTAPTLQGMILGTAAYMSPEQARGNKVDKRTDLWAFGCVLYELLTGKQAFEGETVTETLAAVLKAEPDWTQLPATTPASIRVLLRRCLQKDLTRRLRDVTDARIEIEEAFVAPPAAETTAAPLRARPTGNVWRWALVSGLVSSVLVALAVGIAIWNLRAPAPRPTTRSTITLPDGAALASLNLPEVAISPDGSHLAYVATRGGGTQQIFLRALDSLESKPIEGTEGASVPFFSPDGQWLGFFAGTNLKKISITGGASVTVCNFGGFPSAASWGANDTIAVNVFAGFGLSQVSAAGGTPQALTKIETAKGERTHHWPQFLPGGKSVLFTVLTPSSANFDEARIAVQQLETGERKVLVQGGTYGRYISSGHLTYVRNGTLMAAPFDLKRLEVTGPAVPVVERIMSANGSAQLSISDQGSLVYVPGSARGAADTLVWVDRKGVEQPVAAPPRPYAIPRLSPDGRLLAVDTLTDIWLYDIPRGTFSRLTFDGASSFPLWSPDGKRLAFRSAREGKPPNLFWKPADGNGPEERLTNTEHQQYPASWSPDGQAIAIADAGPTTGYDLWALPLSGALSRTVAPAGERNPSSHAVEPRLFLQTSSHESGAKFSPDGRWLAYGSNVTGRFEIYVQAFPGPGGKWQISTDGGLDAVWARNGELFFRSGNRMMAVQTKTQPTFSAGAPRLLFEGVYQRSGSGNANYDVTADGQRFIMVKAASQEATAPTQINVVLNWFEELKRRVPVK